jgi:hypothetical protein
MLRKNHRNLLLFVLVLTMFSLLTNSCSLSRESTDAPSSKTIEIIQEELAKVQTDLLEEQNKRKLLEDELVSLTETLTIRTGMLEGLLAQSQTTEQLLVQKENESQVFSSIRGSVDLLINDRLLLIQLRKEAPIERNDATEHWRNIKLLATQSDPALSRPASRILDASDAFFSWREKTFSSQEEATTDFFTTGAGTYRGEIEDFKKKVLLTLILRLDTIIQQTES